MKICHLYENENLLQRIKIITTAVLMITKFVVLELKFTFPNHLCLNKVKRENYRRSSIALLELQ